MKSHPPIRKSALVYTLAGMILLLGGMGFLHSRSGETEVKRGTLVLDFSFPREESDILMRQGKLFFAHDLLCFCDDRQNRIFVFTPEGKAVRTVGQTGRGPGDLNGPFGLYAVDDGYAVHSIRNRRVQYFNGDWEYRDAFQLHKPGYLVYNPVNDLFYLTPMIDEPGEDHLIDVISREGKKLRGFGEKLRFNQSPAKDIPLAVDESGNITLVYWSYHIVRKYTPGGDLLWERKIHSPYIDRLLQRNLQAKNNSTSLIFTAITCYDGHTFVVCPENSQGYTGIIFRLNQDGVLTQKLYIPISGSNNQEGLKSNYNLFRSLVVRSRNGKLRFYLFDKNNLQINSLSIEEE